MTELEGLYYVNGDDGYFALYHIASTEEEEDEGHYVCEIEAGTQLEELIKEATQHECPIT